MVKDLFHLRHKVSGVKAKGAGNALKGMQEWECSKKVERGEGGEAGVAGDAQGWRCSAVQQSTQNALSTCKKMALSQESKRERSWSKMKI